MTPISENAPRKIDAHWEVGEYVMDCIVHIMYCVAYNVYEGIPDRDCEIARAILEVTGNGTT